jgi:hypothetical protein
VGVLLDHSGQRAAQRHRPSAAAVLIVRIVAGDVEGLNGTRTHGLGYVPASGVVLPAERVPAADRQGHRPSADRVSVLPR